MKTKVLDEKGRVLKAGGIIVKEDHGRKYILLVHRSMVHGDFYNDWSFPKGSVDDGESAEQAAIREAKEETGLDTEVVKEITENEYYNPVLKELTVIKMYILKPLNFNIRLVNETDEAAWVLIDEIPNKLTYPNLREYFEAVKDQI